MCKIRVQNVKGFNSKETFYEEISIESKKCMIQYKNKMEEFKIVEFH